MRLEIDHRQKEVKKHGSFGFPVRASFEQLSNFDQGSFPWHWHPEIELTYIVSGEMYYRINGQEYHVHEGDALFSNTNALHAGTMSNGKNCQYVSITFHPRILAGFAGSQIEQDYLNPVLENVSFGSIHFLRNEEQTAKFLEKASGIYDLLKKKPQMYVMEVQIQLLEIWKLIYTAFEKQGEQIGNGTGREIERLRDILDYMHGHYSEQISLEDIAGSANLCKSECCRFFKKQMHETLFEYLMAYRISMSLTLLREGYNITEAGLQCGFVNPAYYSKVFKEIMGISPREYKKGGQYGKC